jgi:hypothetical protein
VNRIIMSAAASALLRALIARSGVPRDRILLTDMQSVDWQSLTFVGERHVFHFRVPGDDSAAVAERLCNGLEDAEFKISGQIVADISIADPPVRASDGSTSLTIEALTVAE